MKEEGWGEGRRKGQKEKGNMGTRRNVARLDGFFRGTREKEYGRKEKVVDIIGKRGRKGPAVHPPSYVTLSFCLDNTHCAKDQGY